MTLLVSSSPLTCRPQYLDTDSNNLGREAEGLKYYQGKLITSFMDRLKKYYITVSLLLIVCVLIKPDDIFMLIANRHEIKQNVYHSTNLSTYEF